MTDTVLAQQAAAPVFRTLGGLAFPLILATVLGALANALDTAFISYVMQSEAAVAALSVVFPLQLMLGSLGAALGGGLAVLLSTALGERDHESAGKLFSQAIGLTLLLGSVCSALLVWQLPAVLLLLQTPEELIPLAVSYATPVLIGATPLLLVTVCCEALRAQAFNRLMLWLVLSEIVFNTLLNALLIIVLDMGVAGAGLATALSGVLSLLLVVWLFSRRSELVRFSWSVLWPKMALAGRLLLFGLPLWLNTLGIVLMVASVNVILSLHPPADLTQALAAFGLFIKLMMLIIMPMQGFSGAFQTLAAFHHGSGDYTRLRATLWAALQWTFGYAVVLYLLMMLAGHWLFLPFGAPEALTAASVGLLHKACLLFPLYAVFFVTAAYFMAISRPGVALVIYLSHNYLFFLPFAWIFSSYWPEDGLWWAFVATDFVSALFGSLLLLRQWRLQNEVPVVVAAQA